MKKTKEKTTLNGKNNTDNKCEKRYCVLIKTNLGKSWTPWAGYLIHFIYKDSPKPTWNECATCDDSKVPHYYNSIDDAIKAIEHLKKDIINKGEEYGISINDTNIEIAYVELCNGITEKKIKTTKLTEAYKFFHYIE